MVWQEEVESIIMATRLIERGHQKCHRYWPDVGRTLDTADFHIENLSAERLDDKEFLVTTLKLTKVVCCFVPVS